jgi:hypothetical protein
VPGSRDVLIYSVLEDGAEESRGPALLLLCLELYLRISDVEPEAEEGKIMMHD